MANRSTKKNKICQRWISISSGVKPSNFSLYFLPISILLSDSSICTHYSNWLESLFFQSLRTMNGQQQQIERNRLLSFLQSGLAFFGVGGGANGYNSNVLSGILNFYFFYCSRLYLNFFYFLFLLVFRDQTEREREREREKERWTVFVPKICCLFSPFSIFTFWACVGIFLFPIQMKTIEITILFQLLFPFPCLLLFPPLQPFIF